MSPTSSPQRICILRLSAIGDTCHVLPVIHNLRKALPGVAITWVIGRLEETLMRGLPGVELVVFDKAAGWRELLRLRRALAGHRFDVLLQMQASLRASLVARTCLRAPLRIGFDRARAVDFQWLFTNRRIAPGSCEHVMDGLFGFAQALGVSGRELRWDIPLDQATHAWVEERLGAHRPRLVISPCSSQRARNYRNWPVQNYIEVARFAARRYAAQIVLTGGGSARERDYAAAICDALAGEPGAPGAMNLAGATNLKQLLAILASADLLIGPDSGPVHMANAVGTPVLGLYATSNPLRSGPYCRREWTVNAYPEAVRREFGKAESELRWGQRVRDPRAMELVGVDAVTARLARFFGEQS